MSHGMSFLIQEPPLSATWVALGPGPCFWNSLSGSPLQYISDGRSMFQVFFLPLTWPLTLWVSSFPLSTRTQQLRPHDRCFMPQLPMV